MANGAVSELTYTGFIGTKNYLKLLNISISYKKLYNLCFSHGYFGQISLEFSFRRT